MPNRYMTEKTWKRWNNDEIEYVRKMFNDGYSVEYIANKLGRSVWSIKVKTSRFHLRDDTFRKWSKEDVQKLKNLVSTERYNISEMAEILNRTERGIKNKISSEKINTNYLRTYNRYNINYNFFDKDSPLLYYFLGFFFADGNLHGNRLSINLIKSDELFLEKLVRNFSDSPIRDRGKKYNSVLWVMGDKKLASIFRERFGLLPNKSHNIKYPDYIPTIYNRDFIRGFFDGDGGVYYRNNVLLSNISSMSEDFIIKLKEILNENNINPNLYKTKYGLNILVMPSKESRNFQNYIYYEDCFCLKRKRSVFMNSKVRSDYYTVHDLSKLFGVNHKIINEWREKYKLPYEYMDGNGYLYSEKNVDIWRNKLYHLITN